jgi:hypothetical protein
MQIGIAAALIIVTPLLLFGCGAVVRSASLYAITGVAFVTALIIVANPEVRVDRPMDEIQSRAVRKHGKFIEAIDKVTDKYRCREVIRPALDVYADPADNIENWPFKHPLCDPYTRERLLEHMQRDFAAHSAELLHAQIDDMNVVDAEVGCHSLARSGIGAEQIGVRWPDSWPYAFPPCTASPDNVYNSAADIRQSDNNGLSEETRQRSVATTFEVTGQDKTR